MIKFGLNKWGEINILDPIGESGMFGKAYSYRDFVEDLDAQLGELKINISTLGGSAKEALSIYDHLRSVSYPVTTRIVGNTASAGTLISLAGDIREMHENAQYFIHRAQLTLQGNADEIREQSKLGDEYDKKILKIYSDRTGKSADEIWNLMQQETWLSAQDALEWGFITNIISDMKIKKQQVALEMPDEEEKEIGIVPESENPEPKKPEETEEELEVPDEEKEEEEDPKVLQKIIAGLQDEIKNLMAKLEEKEISEAEMRAHSVSEVVNDFVKKGIITNADQWVDIGLSMDIEKFKTLLGGISKSERLSKEIEFRAPQVWTIEQIRADWRAGKINKAEFELRLKSIGK
jgi:ATP-dependent Clp protease protease subunit